jgi:hypothetical protein
LGDSWSLVTPERNSAGSPLGYINNINDAAIAVRGSRSTSEDYGRFSNSNAGRYHDQWNSFDRQVGMFRATSPGSGYDSYSSTAAHNGLCFAVPIALVQRRNSGAYHPVFNSEGTALFLRENGNLAAENAWYNSNVKIPSTAADCFKLGSPSENVAGNVAPFGSNTSGAISDNYYGRPDGKFYDAIYASDVQDLRMSSKKLPLAEIREKYKRMAIAGDVRGFEAVLFTHNFGNSIGIEGTGWLKVPFADISGDISRFTTTTTLQNQGHHITTHEVSTGISKVHDFAFRDTNLEQLWIREIDGGSFVSGDWMVALAEEQTHKQAKPTWTDLIGSTANLMATFPEGVEGQWIPVVPDGSTPRTYPLNRKSINTVQYKNTSDSGSSWSSGNLSSDTTQNALLNYAAPLARVSLWQYETQAHFTEDSNNVKVLDLGGVSVGNFYNPSWGGLLSSTLIGKVSIGSSNYKWRNASDFEYTLRTDTEILDTSTGQGVEHTTFSMLPSPASTAVKTLDYLSSENGVAQLSYAYKEMVYDSGLDSPSDMISIDGTTSQSYTAGNYYKVTGLVNEPVVFCVLATPSLNFQYLQETAKGYVGHSSNNLYFTLWDGNGWGDNNQFEIANNQTTQTDDNGNTVLYGTASFDTQYFVVEE